MNVLSLLALGLTTVSSMTLSKNTSSCSGTPNTQPIITDEPTFIREVTNGKLFSVDGGGILSPPLLVAHMWGTAYEMGYAYGELLKNESVSLLNQTMEYLEVNIEKYLIFFSPEERQIIAEEGITGALDYVYDLAYPFIPQRYIDEMQGLADASGVAYKQIARMAMIPEAVKAHCTMAGAWNEATSDDFSLVQLRALDWDTDGPFQQYPVVLVYHPSEEGHSFSVLSWTGLVGAITGYGNGDLGICEKVWLSYKGRDSRLGTPFTFVLRDILQFDSTREEGIQRIEDSKRTCSIWVGLGDSQSNEMNIIQYSHENATVYSNENFPYYTDHPDIKDTIYVDKHVQPSHDPCLGELMNYNWGNITSNYMFQNVAAQLQTGDMHIAVYDYQNRYMFVSNAAVYVPGQTQELAYQRSFVQLNMQTQLNMAPPTSD